MKLLTRRDRIKPRCNSLLYRTLTRALTHYRCRNYTESSATDRQEVGLSRAYESPGESDLELDGHISAGVRRGAKAA